MSHGSLPSAFRAIFISNPCLFQEKDLTLQKKLKINV